MSKKNKQIRHKAGAHTFWLKPLPQGPLMMALSEEDKPEIPNTEVTYAGGVKVNEPNPNDPKYKNDIETWRAIYNSRLFRLCIVHGIDRVENGQGGEARPSEEAQEKVRFIYGNQISRYALLLYWYADLLGDTSQGFMSLVMGQSEVTESGLEEAEDSFRGSSDGTRSSEADENQSTED